MASALTCPDCRLDLGGVESGPTSARRCSRCRGLWLDPASFQLLCEAEAPPAGTPAPATGSPPGGPRRARPEEKVRYRACPRCGDVMGRTHFARVSGVVVDVCRPHGVWFDRGELAAIRTFLRTGGLGRYDRIRREEALPTRPRPAPRSGLAELLDLLVSRRYPPLLPEVPGVPQRVVIAIIVALACLWVAWELAR